MYKVTFSTTYTDTFYAADIDKCFAILAKLNKPKIIEIGYVYKYLFLFWQYNPCFLTKAGEYKTFKQLSKKWYCK